jgi:two-component system response regulator FlrC
MEKRVGRFEAADTGTLFLDEIGEITPSTQVKLLRFLETKSIERVGGSKPIQLDVRLVAATNRDLEQLVREGKFREDLYFRLAVFPIRVPPLRERPGDILALARSFLSRYSQGGQVPQLSASAEHSLLTHAWPGNVRELENAIQRAILMCDHGRIEARDIELEAWHGAGESAPPAAAPRAAAQAPAPESAAAADLQIEAVERQHILQVLAQVGGNRKKAVALLGLSERALRYKLKAYREQFPHLHIPESS